MWLPLAFSNAILQNRHRNKLMKLRLMSSTPESYNPEEFHKINPKFLQFFQVSATQCFSSSIQNNRFFFLKGQFQTTCKLKHTNNKLHTLKQSRTQIWLCKRRASFCNCLSAQWFHCGVQLCCVGLNCVTWYREDSQENMHACPGSEVEDMSYVSDAFCYLFLRFR